MSITFWLILWILTLFSALNISVNTAHPDILRQLRLKWEIKFNWGRGEVGEGAWKGGHENMKFFFSKSLLSHEISSSIAPMLQKVFWKICKILRPPNYIPDVHSLKDYPSITYITFPEIINIIRESITGRLPSLFQSTFRHPERHTSLVQEFQWNTAARLYSN